MDQEKKSSMDRPSRATIFAKKHAEQKLEPEASESSVVAKELLDEKLESEPSKEKEEGTSQKDNSVSSSKDEANNKPSPKLTSITRSKLPKKELSHRVRTDIHGRLDDEQYRRKKLGEPVPLAEIADEALHLGLKQIEKRSRN